MTRLGDLLDFGPLLKPSATINLPNFGQFLWRCQNLSFLGNFYRYLAIFFRPHWLPAIFPWGAAEVTVEVISTTTAKRTKIAIFCLLYKRAANEYFRRATFWIFNGGLMHYLDHSIQIIHKLKVPKLAKKLLHINLIHCSFRKIISRVWCLKLFWKKSRFPQN